jgi:hypothetical protein
MTQHCAHATFIFKKKVLFSRWWCTSHDLHACVHANGYKRMYADSPWLGASGMRHVSACMETYYSSVHVRWCRMCASFKFVAIFTHAWISPSYEACSYHTLWILSCLFAKKTACSKRHISWTFFWHKIFRGFVLLIAFLTIKYGMIPSSYLVECERLRLLSGICFRILEQNLGEKDEGRCISFSGAGLQQLLQSLKNERKRQSRAPRQFSGPFRRSWHGHPLSPFVTWDGIAPQPWHILGLSWIVPACTDTSVRKLSRAEPSWHKNIFVCT